MTNKYILKIFKSERLEFTDGTGEGITSYRPYKEIQFTNLQRCRRMRRQYTDLGYLANILKNGEFLEGQVKEKG